MTEVDTLPAAGIIRLTFRSLSPTAWAGRASCDHGAVDSTTHLAATTQPEPTTMVDALLANHQLVIACDCVLADPPVQASLTFQLMTGVPPGQRRVIPQSGGAISASTFYWGPPLNCLIRGSYYLKGKIDLTRSVAAGGGGIGYVQIGGQNKLVAKMLDRGQAMASATFEDMLTINPNEVLNVLYENTTDSPQDIQTTALKVHAVWVP